MVAVVALLQYFSAGHIKNKVSSQFTLAIYSKSFGCSPVSVTKKVDAIILLPFSSLNLILGT